MLEISHLKLVKALQEFGTVSQAAESLYISQSALSHQIKKLEDLLQDTIFVRHSDPIKLTTQGRKLLDFADTILPKVAMFEQELLHIESRRLQIAIECHVCFDWLMPTLDAYHIKQPKVDFDLSLAFSFEPMTALKNYDVDMVITSDPRMDTNFAYFPLFEYQMFMVMAKEHTLADTQYLQPKDLQNQVLLTYPVEHSRLDIFNYFLTPAKIMPHKIRKVELPLMITRLIMNNQGVATMPSWSLTASQKSQLCLKPLGENGLWRTLFVAVRENDKHLAHLQDFITIAKQVSLQTLKGIK
jgi:LysR family transcriptional regulator for metE and metH